MDHHRLMTLAVFANVLQFEARREGEVELHRRQLPETTENVNQLDIDFGAVKRGFAGDRLERNSLRLQHAVERADGEIPVLIRARVTLAVVWIPGGKLNPEFVKSERLQYGLGKVDARFYLAFDLARACRRCAHRPA